MGSIPITRSTLARSVLAIIAAMVSIQTGAAIAKSLFPALTPAGTTTLRLALATVLLLIVLRPWRNLRWLRRAPTLRVLVLYGCALGAMNLLYYIALRGLPLGVAVAIEFAGPLAVAVWNSRRTIDFAWIALAVVGLATLLPWHPAAAPLPTLALLAAFGSAAAWAAYIVSGQRLGRDAPDKASGSVALGMVVATVVAAPVGIATGGAALLDTQWLPAAFAVALLSSAIPYPLEMKAMQRLPAHTFGVLMSLEPAIAALAGWLLLEERLTGTQWLAVGSIITASAGAAATARSAEAARC